MATGDIIVGSDNELAIEIGPWAKDKLFYVEHICDIFNKSMKNKWPIRTYVDLFAGPGKCVVKETREEIPGSPLIALSCKAPFTHYFFNDLNPELIKALKSRTAFCNFAEVHYFNKDCNSVIYDLLQHLPADSLDFCFIDPLSWEINFDSIRRLTQNRSMDLLITFHIGSIRRDVDNPTQELIKLLPTTDWQQKYRDAISRGKRVERILLDIYEEGLRSIGYKEIRDHISEKNSKNVRLYYLIFASKHPRGSYFWDEITRRSEAGQIRMQI